MATDTIPAAPAAANPYESGPWRDACDMEEPLALVRDLLTGLMYLGQTLDDGGSAVARIADIARDKCEQLEALRGNLFHELHPGKAEFAGQSAHGAEVGA